VTFDVPTGWTLNGATTAVVFETFDGPAEFLFYFRPVLNDAVVRQLR
jgi:hypothetical protein